MNELSCIHRVPVKSWSENVPAPVQHDAVNALEEGRVLFSPELAFRLEPDERRFLDPNLVSHSKNVSFDISSGKVGGCTCAGADADQLAAMMKRFAEQARALIDNLLPSYRSKLRQGRTSLRPVEIAGRVSSWRKDDTRLHVDSFPSTPLQGRRILRVFTNVNPDGKPRSWRIGEPFEEAARNFVPSIGGPVPGSAFALRLFRITKSARSRYDHYMLQMHDLMKKDEQYQRASKQLAFNFPPGTTWAAFTDQVLHAAMAGQHQLEQTFYLPVDAMLDPQRSPLRILERLTDSMLVN